MFNLKKIQEYCSKHIFLDDLQCEGCRFFVNYNDIDRCILPTILSENPCDWDLELLEKQLCRHRLVKVSVEVDSPHGRAIIVCDKCKKILNKGEWTEFVTHGTPVNVEIPEDDFYGNEIC